MFLYCINCNLVHGTKDDMEDYRYCQAEGHKLANITNKQYIQWVLDDKKPLNVRLKNKD